MGSRSSSLAICAAAAALLGSCRAASPAACTTCSVVAGHYSETAESATVDCGDNHFLGFSGTSDAASLAQTNSALSLRSSFGAMPGVLHDDGSATFGPIPAVAHAVDGTGTVDPSGKPTPGKLSLEGFFLPLGSAAAASSFAGTYVFVADDDGCELDSRATWHR